MMSDGKVRLKLTEDPNIKPMWEYVRRPSLQTKNPNTFPVYSTSREYIGEYAGNMPLLVPYSSDSQISQTNYCSTFKYLANIPIFYDR